MESIWTGLSILVATSKLKHRVGKPSKLRPIQGYTHGFWCYYWYTLCWKGAWRWCWVWERVERPCWGWLKTLHRNRRWWRWQDLNWTCRRCIYLRTRHCVLCCICFDCCNSSKYCYVALLYRIWWRTGMLTPLVKSVNLNNRASEWWWWWWDVGWLVIRFWIRVCFCQMDRCLMCSRCNDVSQWMKLQMSAARDRCRIFLVSFIVLGHMTGFLGCRKWVKYEHAGWAGSATCNSLLHACCQFFIIISKTNWKSAL